METWKKLPNCLISMIYTLNLKRHCSRLLQKETPGWEEAKPLPSLETSQQRCALHRPVTVSGLIVLAGVRFFEFFESRGNRYPVGAA